MAFIKHASNSHSFSTFNTDNSSSSSEQGCLKLDRKGYLLLLILIVPLLLLLLYFLLGFLNPAVSGASLGVSPYGSELRALYLLRQQQFGLVSLLNHTLGILGSNSSSLNSAMKSVVEDFKGGIYKGIELNKEIQEVLLSSYNDGNVLESSDIDMCGKVNHRLSERRTVEWKPRPDKYLFAICTSGQMSNHLICLEKHMFFAALLGRVLVIPSPKVDYNFSQVLDIVHVNKCLGRKVVVSFEEFHEAKKEDLRVDRFVCYFSMPQKCFVDGDQYKKLESLGLALPKLESPWVEDVGKPKKRTVQDVKDKFSTDDDVIAIGDVFFADVENDWMMQPGGPIAHTCKTLIEPSRLIMLTAQRFVQTFLGKEYLALHFRRHGWLKFCNAKKPSCFYSVPQAADCIKRVIQRANTPVVYLSTDAADSETGLLRSLVFIDGKSVALVQRPALNSAEKWDALLYRHGLEGNPQVEAMLDKTICAMSKVFVGSSGSTFTEDILRLRKGWGLTSLCDEYMCQGELPNFIAEDE